MANMMKFTKMAAMAVIAHQERTCTTHSNENIDPERTKENYSVWPLGNPDKIGEKHGWKRLTSRLREVKYLKRKDVNVLVEWVIHKGVDVPPGFENEKAFFQSCMNYIANKYGIENICYGIVHKDEEEPHLTVGFVPVVRKKLKLRKNASERLRQEYEEAVAAGKTYVETVDADSVITRKHLQDWHGGLTKHLKDELGYDPAVYTGITKAVGGNMTVKQLKNKPKDWREKRNKYVEAFHNRRRAAQKGERESLNDTVILSTSEPPQARTGAKNEPKKESKSLFDKIREAGGRGNE